jgi:hypothetical protein
MSIALITWTIVGLFFGAAASVFVMALINRPSRLWNLLGAAVLIAIGAVPPSAVAVLWWAKVAAYAWAIHGPGVFGHLGSGPIMTAMLTSTVAWTAVCWAVAAVLTMRAYRTCGSEPARRREA